ncbi:MAG: IclR family transcriptional regulator [Acidimicrobiia bacterium]|nr:IclR family transcriptional regulator [Acidimicrobiia bacterium]MDH5519043.1 IclR family transcriptional regulator [Acidimicrobiia bacterium]
MADRSTSSSVESGPIERAFVMLQAVVASDGPVGVRELGRRTGLPRSTASRLVGQLNAIGMVERTADGLVTPGSALATLTVDGPRPLLRDRLRPLLVALADGFGETATLAVDDGDAVLYVSQIDADNAVTAPDVEAERHPFHVVAHGLVLMAHWPDERLDAYLTASLSAPTGRSMTDPTAIRRRLKRIRTDGYVWTEEEFDVGVNGLAAPIMTDGDGPVASVGLYGPSYRLSPTVLPDLAEALVETVGRQTVGLL